MNTELQNAVDSPPRAPSFHAPFAGRRRNGKVAKLPKAIRDQINELLLDGVSYLDIIKKIGPPGENLNEDNLANWKGGGYLDWLEERHHVEAIRVKQELLADLFCQQDPSTINQTAIQLATTNLCELLLDLNPISLRERLQSDPDKYTRLLNAIARLSDGHLRCERQRSQEAELKAKLAREKLPREKRGISQEALQEAERKLRLL
jgi:hypothetical protein